MRTALFVFLASLAATLSAQTPDLGNAATVAELLTKPAPVAIPNWQQTRADRHTTEYEAFFTSALLTPYAVNNRVPLALLMPIEAKKSVPVVFILHYLGARDLRAERQLGHELNLRGIAAAIIALPYHLSRAPEGTRSGELAVQPDPVVLTSTMVQSVLDVRRALQIVKARPDIDPNQFGVAGISLGSLVAEIAFGIEPEFKRAGFLLGGANLAHILWTSSRVIVSRSELRSEGYTEAKLKEALKPIEPATYLERRKENNPRTAGNALAIGGRFDTVIPPINFRALTDALPHPVVININTGHYGGIFVQKRLLSEVATYFADSAEGKTYFAPKDIQEPTLRLVAQAATPTGFDIGVGVDLFKTHANYEQFGTIVVTARSLELFVGQALGGGLAAGGFAGTRGLAAGIFWSSVL